MLIKNYHKFLEARLSDLLKIQGEGELADKMREIKDKEFDLKQKLPSKIELDNGQILKIRWFDNAIHRIVNRLKDRTSFADVDHFIEVISEKLAQVFPFMLGKQLFKSGKYTIYIGERNTSIIIGFDLGRNFEDECFIDVITVLPGRKGENVVKIIDL